MTMTTASQKNHRRKLITGEWRFDFAGKRRLATAPVLRRGFFLGSKAKRITPDPEKLWKPLTNS
jgi:hypothetical protein